MKTLLCLAALVVLAASYPRDGPYYPSYQNFPEKYPPEFFEDVAELQSDELRVTDCYQRRARLPWNDVISQKFYVDHICRIRGPIRRYTSSSLSTFCRDFRRGPPVYQLMLLTDYDINRLRNDLQGHQNDFFNDRNDLRPNPSRVHYSTDDTYDFIYCQRTRGTWIGYQRSNQYQRYVPRAYSTLYQIYHGCRPVTTYPGFRQNGSC